MPVQFISAREFRRVPWKNGKGMTTEICSDAAERSGEWSWRVSAADVPTRAPFSHFPGVDRHMLCIAGALRLHEGAAQHAVGRMVPCDGPALQFAGESDVTGEPLSQVTRDLNLMVNRALWCGHLERVHAGGVCDVPNAAHVILYCAWGEARLEIGGAPLLVAAGDAAKVVPGVDQAAPRVAVVWGSVAVACVAPIS